MNYTSHPTRFGDAIVSKNMIGHGLQVDLLSIVVDVTGWFSIQIVRATDVRLIYQLGHV